MEILKAAMLYFSFVSAVGFLLGPLRNFSVTARAGGAALVEAPLMLVVIALGAWLILRRRAALGTPPARLAIGLTAVGLTVAIEVTGAIWVRGVTLAQYLAGRDVVSGAVYLLLLCGLVVMPLVVVPARR